MASNFVEYWNGSYLGGNVHYNDTDVVFTNPYTFIDLPSSTGKILVCGFLYSMTNQCNNTDVDDVTDYLATNPFDDVVNDTDIKLVVGLCHISTTSSEVDEIYSHLREKFPTLPIVLLTGHSHQNYQSVLPKESTSVSELRTLRSNAAKNYTAPGFALESGCYMRTVGLLEFELPLNTSEMEEAPNVTFTRTFINGNKSALMDALNITDSADFTTDVGTAIDEESAKASAALQLDTVLGTAPQTYRKTQSPKEGEVSVFMLIANTFLPSYKSHYRATAPSTSVTTLFAVSYSSVRSLSSPSSFLHSSLL